MTVSYVSHMYPISVDYFCIHYIFCVISILLLLPLVITFDRICSNCYQPTPMNGNVHLHHHHGAQRLWGGTRLQLYNKIPCVVWTESIYYRKTSSLLDKSESLHPFFVNALDHYSSSIANRISNVWCVCPEFIYTAMGVEVTGIRCPWLVHLT